MNNSRQRALLDLERARAAWNANRPVMLAPNPGWDLIGPARRERYLFQLARRAMNGGARLDPEDHESLLAEVRRVQDREEVPAAVRQYLALHAGRGRPRRLDTARSAAEAVRVIWLLRGYYRRRGVVAPLQRAKESAGLIVNKGVDTIDAWWKANRLPPW